jgi:hypothetical protein
MRVTLPTYCSHCDAPLTLLAKMDEGDDERPAPFRCPICGHENSAFRLVGRVLEATFRGDDDPGLGCIIR